MPSDLSSPMDDAGVRKMVVEHFDFVWRFLRRLGVGEADVDDMAQQVFLVLNSHRGAPCGGSERAYLAGVARRIASTYRRTQRRRREVAAEPVAELQDLSPSPEELADRSRAGVLLDKILEAAMTEEEREVFVLFEIEQVTMSEIALSLSIPPGTVASRLRRARTRFEAAVAAWRLDSNEEAS